MKTDLGTLVLSGVNTYSGGTAINGGTLQVANDTNLGAPTGSLSFDGGTLATTASFASARTTTLNAGGGTFDIAPTTTLTLSGVISGAGTLTKVDTGTLILTANNTYTGGTTIAALVDRFNRLKTGAARFSAVRDRTPQLTAISDELSKKLPNAHLDLKEAIQRGDLSLQMCLSGDERRFNNVFSYIAYPAYLSIVYTLEGIAWSLAIFGIYLLGAQFFLWYRLIRDHSLELRCESGDRDFGLRPLTEILRVFYVLVVVGASYVLLQSVSCERGGTIEFRIFNIILVALTALIFVVGLVAIELETRSKRDLYINEKGLEEAKRKATTKEEQEKAEEKLNLVKAQRFLRFSPRSISTYGLPVVALALYPFWPDLDKQINDIWNKVDAAWVATVLAACRLLSSYS